MVVSSWTGWRREERAIGKLAVIDQAVRSVSGLLLQRVWFAFQG